MYGHQAVNSGEVEGHVVYTLDTVHLECYVSVVLLGIALTFPTGGTGNRWGRAEEIFIGTAIVGTELEARQWEVSYKIQFVMSQAELQGQSCLNSDVVLILTSP